MSEIKEGMKNAFVSLPPPLCQVDGILVQLPLPHHIHEKTICNAVPSEKDVDGFHNDNIG